MLIRRAEIYGSGVADLRIAEGRVAAIGALSPLPGEQVIDAQGGALLPGLHDHHIHLAALAAKRASISCGPPDVFDEAGLATALQAPGEGWLRGTGYHDSVAGMLDASQLDQLAPHRSVRIQHRSGRMWFLNSRAIEALLEKAPAPPGLERVDGRWTGRMFEEDTWLRATLGNTPPNLRAASDSLTSTGITGITDLSPSNDPTTAAYFSDQQRTGNLRLRVVMGGALSLVEGAFDEQLQLGPAKLHLHESALPDFDVTADFIRAAHAQGRVVAIHCVTETELVFSLAALEAAGTMAGDRIEHASIVPDALAIEIARLNLHVVSQPNFIAERGDLYLRDVEPRDHALLYRLAGLQRAGIVLGGSSDAPFGSVDPWASMRAATNRSTHAGNIIGADEALSPEAALALYLADPHALATQRNIAVGEVADLCLLNRPWAAARTRLLAQDVRATFVAGSIVYDRVDQAPVQSRARIDAAA